MATHGIAIPSSGPRTPSALASPTGLAAVLFCVALPVAVVFANGVAIFDIAHEYVAYRMGQALSLMFGDSFVPAVQGLPNAVLSKVIVAVLYAFYGSGVVSPAALQLYSALFFGSVFAAIVTALAVFWGELTWPQRAGTALFSLLPWHLQPTAILLVAPEYWLAEYAFLLTSLGLSARLHARDEVSSRGVFLLGAWAGVGLTIKISLLGFAPLLFLAIARRDLASGMRFAGGAAAAYLVIVALYAGFQPSAIYDTLLFQATFYLAPNASVMYDSPLSAFTANSHLLLILFVAAGLACAGAKRSPERAAFALLWIALLIYLVAKRPHGTSVASASLSGLFLVAYLAGQLRSLMAPVATAVALALTPAFMFLPQTRLWEKQPPLDAALLYQSDILFMPDNYWNAATPLQALAFNGALALHPVYLAADGRPTVSASAFHALFPGKVLIGASERELGMLRSGLQRGMKVSWTRPPERDNASLRKVLAVAGATVREVPAERAGRKWMVGTASLGR